MTLIKWCGIHYVTYRKIRRGDVLNKLDALGGEKWCNKDQFSKEDAYNSLKAAVNLLDLYRVRANENETGTLSCWQYKQAIVFLKNLEGCRFHEAYHSLWDLVDNQERGIERLNVSEVFTIYLLIKFFICQLEFHGTQRYVDFIEKLIGKRDFILICQYPEVLQELERRNIAFAIVAPENSKNEREKQLIKQQWFGRFILRDNNHIEDMNGWLKLLMENFDSWTNIDRLKSFHPDKIILLKEDQYLSDIIHELR